MSGKKHYNMKRYTIWSNLNLDVDDWIEAYKEHYRDLYEEEPPEKIDEHEVGLFMEETNSSYLFDEIINLSHLKTEGCIVAITDLGFWNGRTMGYKKYDCEVSHCLKFLDNCDYAEFYVEGNDLKSTQYHHDSHHDIRFRELKPNLSLQQVNNFLSKLIDNKCTERDIIRYTRSIGKQIKEVYGWK